MSRHGKCNQTGAESSPYTAMAALPFNGEQERGDRRMAAGCLGIRHPIAVLVREGAGQPPQQPTVPVRLADRVGSAGSREQKSLVSCGDKSTDTPAE